MSTQNEILTDLQNIKVNLSSVVNNSYELNTEEAWLIAYKYIFSENVSRRALEILSEIGINTDYYDPDGSYKEDVETFKSFFDEKFEVVEKMFSFEEMPVSKSTNKI